MDIYIYDKTKCVKVDDVLTLKDQFLKEVALKNNILTISHKDYPSKREYFKARKELFVPKKFN